MQKNKRWEEELEKKALFLAGKMLEKQYSKSIFYVRNPTAKNKNYIAKQ